MIGFWIGIYLLLGLPFAVGIAIADSDAVFIRRVQLVLTILPIWPVWSVEMVLLHYKKIRMQTVCAWCNEKIGSNKELWRDHLMTCKEHPIRKWLNSKGYDIYKDEDGYYLAAEIEYEEGEP